MKMFYKIFLVLILMLVIKIPGYSATWVHYASNRYLDIDSLKIQNGLVYYWHKVYNDGRFGKNVYYSLEYACANIEKRQLKVIRILDYNRTLKKIDEYSGSNVFFTVPSRTVGDNLIELIKGYLNGTFNKK